MDLRYSRAVHLSVGSGTPASYTPISCKVGNIQYYGNFFECYNYNYGAILIEAEKVGSPDPLIIAPVLQASQGSSNYFYPDSTITTYTTAGMHRDCIHFPLGASVIGSGYLLYVAGDDSNYWNIAIVISLLSV